MAIPYVEEKESYVNENNIYYADLSGNYYTSGDLGKREIITLISNINRSISLESEIVRTLNLESEITRILELESEIDI